jgi:hypothetical protein
MGPKRKTMGSCDLFQARFDQIMRQGPCAERVRHEGPAVSFVLHAMALPDNAIIATISGRPGPKSTS